MVKVTKKDGRTIKSNPKYRAFYRRRQSGRPYRVGVPSSVRQTLRRFVRRNLARARGRITMRRRANPERFAKQSGLIRPRAYQYNSRGKSNSTQAERLVTRRVQARARLNRAKLYRFR